MDRIEIRGLRVLGTHGVLPEEQVRRQPFVLDLTVGLDTRAAAASDDLSDTVDYAGLAARAAAVVERERHQLLERLADRVCYALLEDRRVDEITVTIAKPQAPLGLDAYAVAVTITRRR